MRASARLFTVAPGLPGRMYLTWSSQNLRSLGPQPGPCFIALASAVSSKLSPEKTTFSVLFSGPMHGPAARFLHSQVFW